MQDQDAPAMPGQEFSMRRVYSLLAIAVVVSGLAALRGASAADAQRTFQEAVAEGGELRYIQGIPVLLLEGEPEQIARQQAALVLDVVRRHAHLCPRPFWAGTEAGRSGRAWSNSAAA